MAVTSLVFNSIGDLLRANPSKNYKVLLISAVIPLASMAARVVLGNLLGKVIPIPEDPSFQKMDKEPKHSVKYLMIRWEQKLINQLPPLVKTVLRNRISHFTQLALHVIENLDALHLGDLYIEYIAKREWKKLRYGNAYAKQIEKLRQSNLETEKRLCDLERVNQKIGELKERVAPLLTHAEGQVERIAGQISAEHVKALQIQKSHQQFKMEALETHIELVKEKLDSLLQRHEENFQQAKLALRDYKAVKEHYENANLKLIVALRQMQDAIVRLQNIVNLCQNQ
jgi:hypothetical protein